MKKHEVPIDLSLIQPVTNAYKTAAGYKYQFESQWQMGHIIYGRTLKDITNRLRADTEEAILKQEEREADELACEKAAHGGQKKGECDE